MLPYLCRTKPKNMKNAFITALLLFTVTSFSQKLEFDGLNMDFSKRGTLTIDFYTLEPIEYIIYKDSDKKEISRMSCSGYIGKATESWPKKKTNYIVEYIKRGKKETKKVSL